MRDHVASDFTKGDTYEVDQPGGAVSLTVDAVKEMPRSVRQGAAFSVELQGPMEPVLPQAIYALRRGEVTHEIFIVPVERNPRGVRYEAIFN